MFGNYLIFLFYSRCHCFNIEIGNIQKLSLFHHILILVLRSSPTLNWSLLIFYLCFFASETFVLTKNHVCFWQPQCFLFYNMGLLRHKSTPFFPKIDPPHCIPKHVIGPKGILFLPGCLPEIDLKKKGLFRNRSIAKINSGWFV